MPQDGTAKMAAKSTALYVHVPVNEHIAVYGIYTSIRALDFDKFGPI
jgi:hypothetical protein